MGGFRRGAAALAAALLLAAAGCGTSGKEAEPAWTVYDCGGVQIGVPTAYLEQLAVEIGPVEEEPSVRGPLLLTVSQRAESSHSGEEIWLYEISAIDQAGFERFVQTDHSGSDIFARDDERYYVYSSNRESGLEFVSVDSRFGPDSPEAKNWETLMGLGGSILDDMIVRNGLEPYSENDFWDRPFTYEGAHAYVRYYDYFTFDGDKRMYDQLVLSRPARQGAGGIWCVERWYDIYGNVSPYFPDSGMAAADYYAQLQAACDAGERTDLLTPLGAARAFVDAYNDHETVDESFALAESVDYGYIATNNRIQQLIFDLDSSREVDPLDLLDCAGTFTRDTWGVLGRFMYGSDWWTPLKTGLGEAAVGDRQDLRDANMLHLYGTAHGQFAEAIAGFLAAQRAADPAAFQAALEALPPAERTAVTAALDPAV